MEEINALEYFDTLKSKLEELDGQEIRTTRMIDTRALKDEIRKEIELAENWRMHELYQEMHEAGMVPTIMHEMVGFTNNYNKDFPTYASTPKVA